MTDKPKGDPQQSERDPDQAAPVEQLIAELREEGREVEEGVFTLDRGKALEKMERFQLRDPWAFVLELVQAAVLKGATAIDVEVDALHLTMRFDGEPFSRHELDGVYSALLGRGDTPARRALGELSLAICAIRRLGPLGLEVRSGNGVEGTRLTVTGQGERCEPLTDPLKGTEVRVDYEKGSRKRRATSPRGIGRLWDEVYLEERCLFSEVEVSVNGRRVSEGLTLADGLGVVPLTGEGFSGVAGYVPDLHRSVLHLVKDGVLVASTPLTTAAPGYVAVVSATAFQKDLSQSAIVEDELHQAAHGKAMAAIDEVILKLLSELDRARKKHPELVIWYEGIISRHRGKQAQRQDEAGIEAIPVRIPRRIVEPSVPSHVYNRINAWTPGGTHMGQLLISLLVPSLVMMVPVLLFLSPIHGPGLFRLILDGDLELGGIWHFASLAAVLGILVIGLLVLAAVRITLPVVRTERRIIERGEIVKGVITEFDVRVAQVKVQGVPSPLPWLWTGYEISTQQNIPVAVLREDGQTRIALPRNQNVVFGPSSAETRHLCAMGGGPDAPLVSERWGFPIPEEKRRKKRLRWRSLAAAYIVMILALVGVRQYLGFSDRNGDMPLDWVHLVKARDQTPRLLLMSSKHRTSRIWRMELIDPRTGRRINVRMGEGTHAGPNCGPADPGRFWCHSQPTRNTHRLELWRVPELEVAVSHGAIMRRNPELKKTELHIYQKVRPSSGHLLISDMRNRHFLLGPDTLVAQQADDRGHDTMELHMGQSMQARDMELAEGKLELTAKGDEPKQLVINKGWKAGGYELIPLAGGARFADGRFLGGYFHPMTVLTLDEPQTVFIQHSLGNQGDRSIGREDRARQPRMITAVTVPDGNVLWEVKLNPGELKLSQLVGDLLVVVGMVHDSGSWAMGIEAATGKIRWKR